MQGKEPERSVSALRQAEGDTVLREKNCRNDEITFGNSIIHFSSRISSPAFSAPCASTASPATVMA